MNVDIYVETRFKGNPRGSGSAGAIIEYVDHKQGVHKKEYLINKDYETKNSLQLMICIQALKGLIKPCNVTIHIDSPYIVNTVSKWLPEWKQKNWVRANGKEPANVELWKQISMLMLIHNIGFEKYSSKYKEELIRKLEG